jgi:hypothetical protein
MLTLEQIRERLADRRLMVVAEKTGLHYNTVLAVRKGKKSVEYQVVKALSDYFSEVQA